MTNDDQQRLVPIHLLHFAHRSGKIIQSLWEKLPPRAKGRGGGGAAAPAAPAPLVRNMTSLTPGEPKIESKLPNILFMNLEIFLQKSRLDQWRFSSMTFRNKLTCRNTQTKNSGSNLTQCWRFEQPAPWKKTPIDPKKLLGRWVSILMITPTRALLPANSTLVESY